jgi:hypothetical protein
MERRANAVGRSTESSARSADQRPAQQRTEGSTKAHRKPHVSPEHPNRPKVRPSTPPQKVNHHYAHHRGHKSQSAAQSKPVQDHPLRRLGNPKVATKPLGPKSPDQIVQEERKALLAHLRTLDVVSRDQQSREPVTHHITSDELHDLHQRELLGVQTVFPLGRPYGPPVRVVMGLDFGTSCTKVLIRGPDLPGRRAVAMQVPLFARPDTHPFLWRSWVWLTPGGELSLAPLDQATLICGIKAGLMGERPTSLALAAASDHTVTPVTAAIAYLALMIRQARGWFLSTRREFDRGPLEWSLNLGFPAATLENRTLADLYRRIAQAAWNLAGWPGRITVDTCHSAFAAAASGAGGRVAASVVPEIAAAVAGFAQSARREDGLYAIIDVGAATLDLSTFNLHADRDGLDRLSVLVADVQRFGMEPYRACVAEERWNRPFQRQAGITVRHVIWETRRRRDPNSARWREGARLPVFVTGGGSASELHRAIARSLDGWLQQHSGQRNGVDLRSLDIIEGLYAEASGCDLGRLIVASGLSLPREEIPEVTLPGDIPDVYLPVVQYDALPAISKDQV